MSKMKICRARRKFLGEGLGTFSIDELQRIEQQLERSITKIRVKKAEVFKEQMDQLKEKEKTLVAESTRLSEKIMKIQILLQYDSYSSQQANNDDRENVVEVEAYADQSSPSSYVETELFIGLPETRTKEFLQT
ncbi:MADS-box protein SOC1 [Lathyrus oleraceus]|uniref:MADS-box protein SOC1 n=1 Tax=Pisum sativum TaxID=3888 RepID=UPI0021D24D59|nr:MADS-box protein SOC1-like [Pisum sativum]